MTAVNRQSERTLTADGSSIVPVTSYADVREAYLCPHLSADLKGPGEEHYHAGTMVRLDGDEHMARRRALGRLLMRRGHQRFRDTALVPYAETAIANVLARPDEDGYARVDGVKWVRRVNFQLASALVGYDHGTTDTGADELYELLEKMVAGRPSAVQVVMGGFDGESAAARAGLLAKSEIRTRFYEPALARRRELLRHVDEGRMSRDDLPHDLLTLIADLADPAYADDQLAEREALFVLGAAVHTTGMYTILTIRELFEWLEQHPDDRPLIHDDDFILRASEETLRLHPLPQFFRRAMENIVLSSGTDIPDGCVASIRPSGANVDPTVWGEDASRFDPHRQRPHNVRGYGFSFGGGPHLCFGLPLVMGSDGLDGSLVFLVSTLLRAGAEPDPPRGVALRELSATTSGGDGHGFPLRFPVKGSSNE